MSMIHSHRSPFKQTRWFLAKNVGGSIIKPYAPVPIVQFAVSDGEAGEAILEVSNDGTRDDFAFAGPAGIYGTYGSVALAMPAVANCLTVSNGDAVEPRQQQTGDWVMAKDENGRFVVLGKDLNTPYSLIQHRVCCNKTPEPLGCGCCSGGNPSTITFTIGGVSNWECDDCTTFFNATHAMSVSASGQNSCVFRGRKSVTMPLSGYGCSHELDVEFDCNSGALRIRLQSFNVPSNNPFGGSLVEGFWSVNLTDSGSGYWDCTTIPAFSTPDLLTYTNYQNGNTFPCNFDSVTITSVSIA